MPSPEELVATPPEKLRGYGAQRPSIHESQPRLFKLRQIKPVAGEGFRVGIVLCGLASGGSASAGPPRSQECTEGLSKRLNQRLVLESQNPLRMGLGEPDQPISIPFFLSYVGIRSFLSSVSPSANALQGAPEWLGWSLRLPALWVRPSSKLTSCSLLQCPQGCHLCRTPSGRGGASPSKASARYSRRRRRGPLWGAKSPALGHRGPSR